MRTYTRAVVMQMSEYLHLCMVKAIDTALTDRIGRDWFVQFQTFDMSQPIPVLEKEYTGVNSMDLQSCFKFFRYRDDYAKIVFEYFGHNFFSDTADATKAMNQLNSLLDNLIRNVRNYLYAHASANLVEKGSDTSLRYSVYGANEAVNDMLKFAGFFDKVADNYGKTYYQKMHDLSEKMDSYYYSVEDTVKKEKLRVSSGEFVTACSQLNIPISTTKTGELLFSSANYAGDLAQITLCLNKIKSRKSRKALIIIILILLVVLGALALVFALSDKNSNNGQDTNSTAVTSEQEVTDAPSDATEEATESQTIGDNVFYSPENFIFENDVVSIRPRYVYWEDGNLIAECFVLNGYDHKVYNIDVKSLVFENESGEIANASFGMLENVSIDPDSYIVWTFCFDSSVVTNPDADLSSLITSYRVGNTY